MNEEVTDDDDPLRGLEASFGLHYIGQTIGRTVSKIRADMVYRLARLERYTEYVLGMYYTYDQRQYAEAEVFRLQVELAELHEELINTLVMAPDIGRPIYINT